jgi:imidazole glycerol-phosphate synthase subunit HisH
VSAPRIGIVAYGMGNIASLGNALRAVGADVVLATRPEQLRETSHIVLPGVGAFPAGMERLRALGFEAEIVRLVVEERRALLGICLGMQLLATTGEEHRSCAGLGLVPGRAVALQAGGLRLPHIGWNDTRVTRENSLVQAGNEPECFYYVHGYQLVPEEPTDVVLTCEYGRPFAAGIERGRIFGVQFHPEKSHAAGLTVLKNFVAVPAC